MDKFMKTGDLITVIDFEGRKLLRKAVEISVEVVYVCTEEEYDSALQIGKEPICVGFGKEFVVPCHGSSKVTA
jgi:hypothetical protein